MIRTEVGTWHLHIDAHEWSEAFRAWVEESGYGYVRANFEGHPEGYDHYEPTGHWTWKISWQKMFRFRFEEACCAAKRFRFKGYIEGEFIARVVDLPDVEYVDAPLPFTIERRRLGAVEEFRQDEIHLTCDVDASDPRRIKQLLDAGFFGAYEQKRGARGYQRHLVLTAQGSVRDIATIATHLVPFLETNGGLAGARFKEERAVAWELFGITPDQLPPVVQSIILR